MTLSVNAASFVRIEKVWVGVFLTRIIELAAQIIQPRDSIARSAASNITGTGAG